MKKLITLTLVALLSLTFVFAADGAEVFVKSKFFPQTTQTLCAQLNLTQTDSSTPDNAVVIANGAIDYPVTPGDVYALSYQNPSSNTMTSQNLTVDAYYNVYIPYVGTVNVKGMTFLKFKSYAESQMKAFYAYLNPQFTISKCGSFQVYVYGETKATANVSAWSFARLTDLCSYATDYASSREVEVTYSDGKVKTYDLLKACLLGDESNNPYLTPESKVRFVPAEKTVWITGAVKLPGQYQLKDDETISDLITIARGFSYEANKNAVAVSSYDGNSYTTTSIDFEVSPDYALKNLDTVTVSTMSDLPASVAVQGAVKEGKINYQFVKGETARQVVVAIKDSLLTTSDFDGIYVERGPYKILVSEYEDLVLEEGDVIQVPYRNQQVVVAGGVAKPGTYTYEPGRNVEYYINLAGGYSTDARHSTLKVINQSGFTVDSNSSIMPDYTISVERRNTNTANYVAFGISIASFALTLTSFIINSSRR